jgi:putative hydrolase of the HAD superfamily
MNDFPDLDDIETWIFDLDNTLYPAECDLFAQVAERMGEYIEQFLGVTSEDAHVVRRDYFLRHGTTLRGLMIEHDMDPAPFLAYVHDIDLSPIPLDDRLPQALADLPGRKLIFTNGSTEHARRITAHMGVEHHFEGIFDIVASDYVPKPNPGPYYSLLERFDVDPTASVMIEDIARNLEPAAAMGMTTVWVPGRETWSNEGADKGYVDHTAPDLPAWLSELTGGG